MSNQTKPEGIGAVFGVVCCLFGIGICFSGFDMHSEMNTWLVKQEEQSVTIDPSIVDPKNEGKIIHVIGHLSYCSQEHHDPAFDVRGRGFAMVRQTLQYGYAGGDGGSGEGWHSLREPSVFGDGPEAGADRFRTAVWMPKTVRIGAFTLDDTIVLHWLKKQLPASANVPDPTDPRKPPLTGGDKIRIHLEKASWDAATYKELTFAKDKSGKPTYGDRRVRYHLIKIDPEPVTLLCWQSGVRLEPATRAVGGPFFQTHLGEVDRVEVFAAARQSARRESRITLIVGLVLISAGIGLIVWSVRGMRRWHAQRAQSAAVP